MHDWNEIADIAGRLRRLESLVRCLICSSFSCQWLLDKHVLMSDFNFTFIGCWTKRATFARGFWTSAKTARSPKQPDSAQAGLPGADVGPGGRRRVHSAEAGVPERRGKRNFQDRPAANGRSVPDAAVDRPKRKSDCGVGPHHGIRRLAESAGAERGRMQNNRYASTFTN